MKEWEQEARNKAVYYLQFSAKTESELRKKLAEQGFLPASIDYGFSQLRALEFFVFRKMEMSETINHPLCGCASIVIQKITFPL